MQRLRRTGPFGALVLWVKHSSRRPPVLLHPGLAGAFGEVADAADIGLALGDGNDAAGLEGVEDVARLDRLVVGGERELGGDAAGILLGGVPEPAKERVGVG